MKWFIVFAVLVLGYMLLQFVPLSGREMSEDTLKDFRLRKDQIPIFYSPHYNISFWGLEKLHPFDSKKYGRIYNILTEWGSIKAEQVVEPMRPSRELLLTVHSEDYLERLKSPKKLAEITELGIVTLSPWRITHRKVLVPMLYATGGSILSAKAALDRGWAINLGGGYHHAYASDGGGFCIFADISLSIKYLLKSEDRVKKVMIIDLDAHQGNGHERDFMNRKDIFIMDMYNHRIYPNDEAAKKGIDLKVELEMHVKDNDYLYLLEEGLSKAFEAFSPDIIYYIAGTDIMSGDPLGLMSVSPQGIIKRDQMVFQRALKNKVPIVMLLAGGYQQANAPVIAQSIQNLLTFLKP